MAEQKTTTLLTTVSRNWGISNRRESSGLYRLGLTGFGPTQRLLEKIFSPDEPIEFVFDVNPRTMDLEEPAATDIVPTQDGGQFIESQGQIYKVIVLTGTTGLRPNKREGQIIPILGLPNPFSNPTIGRNGLPQGEESGFERLIKLRNMFRKYWDAKRNPELAHLLEMVWENGKEGEFYVVEPIVFRTKRNSGSPLTSDYEIQLRTIRRYESSLVARVQDPREQRTALSKIAQRITGWTRSLNEALRTVEALIDRSVGIAQSTINTITTPASVLLNGLANINSAATRVLTIPRTSVANLALSANELADSIDRTRMELNAFKTQGISTQLSDLKNAFKRIGRIAAAIHAEESLFFQSTAALFERRKGAYVNAVTGPQPTGGDPSSLSSASTPAGTRLSIVGGNDTIFSVAQRELGDAGRWKELAILNGLEAPYIASTGDGVTVLQQGDNILIPAAGGASTGVSEDTSRKDALIKRLGRDLKITTVEKLGGVNLKDLVVGTSGDLDKAAGIPNIEQAVEIKFGIEQGTLSHHPFFGILVPVGKKTTIRSLIGFQVDAQATLASDSRISDVSTINFDAEGNVTKLNAKVQIEGVDNKLNVGFETRT